MRIAALACVVFAWTGGAAAQILDPASLHVLVAAAQSETSEDLAPIVADVPRLCSGTILWTDAIGIGESTLAEEPAGRAAITRLMEAALIRAGAEPDSVALDRLSTEDISAMHDTVGFPDAGDLLLHLLNRGPSLRDSFGREGYTAQRLAPEGMPFRILQQQTDRPYLGLGPAFTTELLPVEDDPVSMDPREQAKTRRLNLAALPEIVLAAKAFRAVGRAPEAQAIYPLLIAAQAVNRAFLADQVDFRSVLYSTQLKALGALRAYGGSDPVLLHELKRFERRIPRTAFFARLFQSAAAAYRSAPLPPGDRRGQAWAAWGEALSSFAYGAHEGSVSERVAALAVFERLAALVGPDTKVHATIFGLFLSYLPPHEATRLGDTTAWRERVTEVLGADPAWDEGLTTAALERDFAHQMATIGRPDIASRFFMNRIRHAKGRPQERRYLRMLVPFVNDYCGVISFRLSPASGWVRRETEGYNALLDFLDNLDADGQLVGPGEVVVPDGSRPVYSALSPEEDCAAAQAVYGIADAPRPGLFIGRTPDEERDATVAGFEVWVREAMSRSQPAPSVVPYLKLVWLEWFAQAFEQLRKPAVDPLEFRYNAIDASTLTTPERVRDLRQHPSATPQQKVLMGVGLAWQS